jgi:hypothetical protein
MYIPNTCHSAPVCFKLLLEAAYAVHIQVGEVCLVSAYAALKDATVSTTTTYTLGVACPYGLQQYPEAVMLCAAPAAGCTNTPVHTLKTHTSDSVPRSLT